MYAWGGGHPARRLHLATSAEAAVPLAHRPPRPVRARAAAGEEREQLWARWASVDVDLDAYAASRSTETPVVVLEPRSTVVGDDAGNATEIRPQRFMSEQGAKGWIRTEGPQGSSASSSSWQPLHRSSARLPWAPSLMDRTTSRPSPPTT